MWADTARPPRDAVRDSDRGANSMGSYVSSDGRRIVKRASGLMDWQSLPARRRTMASHMLITRTIVPLTTERLLHYEE
jgi:hypothetical protein